MLMRFQRMLEALAREGFFLSNDDGFLKFLIFIRNQAFSGTNRVHPSNNLAFHGEFKPSEKPS